LAQTPCSISNDHRKLDNVRSSLPKHDEPQIIVIKVRLRWRYSFMLQGRARPLSALTDGSFRLFKAAFESPVVCMQRFELLP
jgi:hypothetical protein